MANRTDTGAKNIHGQNPQFLVEKIIRTRIYDSLYWKESCFALTAETIIDKAVALPCIGGQYGNQKPTEFLCLALKMLQLQPEKDILRLYIQNEDYKYLRALGAFYLRLTGSALEIYQYLEPLLLDFRKLRRRNINGEFELTFMDQFVDDLLRSDRVCDTILPRITKRHILEENGDLEPRVSPLEEDLEEEEIIEDDAIANEAPTIEIEIVTDARPLVNVVPNARVVAVDGLIEAEVGVARGDDRGQEVGKLDDGESSRKKIAISSKKVDGLFKKQASGKKATSYKPPAERAEGGAGADSMSIEETNKMRAELGLKPLKA
ncbi:U4/U6-U5 snRNP complex subunit prp38 [Thoreauomyces humboldtii]|nr:U4/U6-U5 snRNP complex subunit prp38 [Thoreauomyces humboldtii]